MNEDIKNEALEEDEVKTIKVFVDFSNDEEIKGFYTEGISENIPETAVEISEELRDKIIEKGGRFKVIDKTKELVADNFEIVPKEKKEKGISEIEQMRADIDFLLIMGGYE